MILTISSLNWRESKWRLKTVLTKYKTSDFLAWHPTGGKISHTRLTERDIRIMAFTRSEISKRLEVEMSDWRNHKIIISELIDFIDRLIAELEGK